MKTAEEEGFRFDPLQASWDLMGFCWFRAEFRGSEYSCSETTTHGRRKGVAPVACLKVEVPGLEGPGWVFIGHLWLVGQLVGFLADFWSFEIWNLPNSRQIHREHKALVAKRWVYGEAGSRRLIFEPQEKLQGYSVAWPMFRGSQLSLSGEWSELLSFPTSLVDLVLPHPGDWQRHLESW